MKTLTSLLTVALLLTLFPASGYAWGAPDFPRRARLEPKVAEKMLVERVAPAYPEAARKESLIGEVLLLAVVSPEGKVERTYHLSGNPILAEAAEAALKKWRYKPHVVEGLSVEFETEVRVKVAPESEKLKS